MNHQSKAETPSGVIAAFASCGDERQAIKDAIAKARGES
jgi:hypothetical protein